MIINVWILAQNPIFKKILFVKNVILLAKLVLLNLFVQDAILVDIYIINNA